MSHKAKIHPQVTARAIGKDGMLLKGAYGLRVYRDCCLVSHARLTGVDDDYGEDDR